MKPSTGVPSFFIGWDVGGWNCDKNAQSRDAIVILDDTRRLVGRPWRGNLRAVIAAATTTRDWLQALFAKCQAAWPAGPLTTTVAIDTPLGFSEELVALITRQGFVEPDETSGQNRYLFRHTERHLFERGLAPLSAIKDMIGSQATKGMHVLSKFAPQTESCGVWADPRLPRDRDLPHRLPEDAGSAGADERLRAAWKSRPRRRPGLRVRRFDVCQRPELSGKSAAERARSRRLDLGAQARMNPIRIFISSVQKEFELERAAVAALISTDPFLLRHCEAVLFEKEASRARPAKQPYLEALKGCHAYVLMIANEYGHPDGEISATHHEYRQAQKLKLPTVVFLKGAKDDGRSTEVRALIAETKKDGFTYKRFHDREDLKPLMLQVLQRLLAEEFDVKATDDEVSEGEHLIEAASTFESAVVAEEGVGGLDRQLLTTFNQRTSTVAEEWTLRSNAQALHARGLLIRGSGEDQWHPTTAAYLLFAPKPANRFPQCEILADAYDDIRITGRPKGQIGINAPLPHALEQVLKFIDDQTLHPHRVVGLNNVRLDEYPTAALREALVNAVAHRSYDDASRKIFVRVFRDRIEVASPGYALKPLTLPKLRKGGYRPCSRNPLIAQALATLSMMEQRGTGFARMREAMLNHGLDEPKIEQQDGFFVVLLPGPAGDYDRIKAPAVVVGPITPAIESQLNERQRIMVVLLGAGEELTSRRCEKEFGVTRPVTAKDFAGLVQLGLAEKVGSGRSTRYRAVIVK